VSYITNNDAPISYKLIDELGRAMSSGKAENRFGSNTFTLEFKNVPAGLYLLLLENKNLALSTKLLKID
jgi:hypothetical protein